MALVADAGLEDLLDLLQTATLETVDIQPVLLGVCLPVLAEGFGQSGGSTGIASEGLLDIFVDVVVLYVEVKVHNSLAGVDRVLVGLHSGLP